MILQEKIQKKAEEYGKLAPVFLEGAKFALENQWISVDEDLPCNHKELLMINIQQCPKTFKVFVTNIYGENWSDYMIYKNGNGDGIAMSQIIGCLHQNHQNNNRR